MPKRIALSDRDNFGKAFQSMLEYRNMSRNQFILYLAELTGSSLSTCDTKVRNWEKGKHAPSLDSTMSILQILGFNLLFDSKD